MGELKFIVYARKSTDSEDRQVRSIGDQLAETAELARRENLRIADTLTEKQSAKTPGRPVFNAMLDQIADGQANAILAWHLNRITRNIADGNRLIDLMNTGRLVEIRCPGVRMRNTPYETFMLMFGILQAKLDIDSMAEGIKRAQRQMLKEGLWPGRAPNGYSNGPNGRIQLDPATAPTIRRVFDDYATGNYSAAQLAGRATAEGFRGAEGGTLTPERILSILRNPLYYGVIRWKGELYAGVHEPLVGKATFDLVQDMLARARRPKTRLKSFRYRGLFQCGECGCMFTCERQKGHTYLRCTKKRGPCDQPYVREEDIDRQVRAAVHSVAIPAYVARIANEIFTAERDQAQHEHAAHLKRIDAAIAAINAKLDALLNLLLKRTISDTEFLSAKNQLVEEKRGLEEAIDETPADRLEPTFERIRAAHRAVFLAKRADMTETVEFFKTIGSNRTISNGRIAWEPVEAWKTLATQGPFADAANNRGAAGGVSRRRMTRREIRCCLRGATRTGVVLEVSDMALAA